MKMLSVLSSLLKEPEDPPLKLPETMPTTLTDGAFCLDCHIYIQVRRDGTCLHCGGRSWMHICRPAERDEVVR